MTTRAWEGRRVKAANDGAANHLVT